MRGAKRKLCSLFISASFVFAAVAGLGGCALFSTRPVQEMSDTASSIRAAREVQADTLAPELYRQANEWFFKAKNEYKLKNFNEARDYAEKARHYAESAEFEAIRSGGNRTEAVTTDPLASGVNNPSPPPPQAAPSPAPYDYPAPKGSMADPTLNGPGGGSAPTPPSTTGP